MDPTMQSILSSLSGTGINTMLQSIMSPGSSGPSQTVSQSAPSNPYASLGGGGFGFDGVSQYEGKKPIMVQEPPEPEDGGANFLKGLVMLAAPLAGAGALGFGPLSGLLGGSTGAVGGAMTAPGWSLTGAGWTPPIPF